jgi:hypothetical protein
MAACGVPAEMFTPDLHLEPVIGRRGRTIQVRALLAPLTCGFLGVDEGI